MVDRSKHAANTKALSQLLADAHGALDARGVEPAEPGCRVPPSVRVTVQRHPRPAPAPLVCDDCGQEFPLRSHRPGVQLGDHTRSVHGREPHPHERRPRLNPTIERSSS